MVLIYQAIRRLTLIESVRTPMEKLCLLQVYLDFFSAFVFFYFLVKLLFFSTKKNTNLKIFLKDVISLLKTAVFEQNPVQVKHMLFFVYCNKLWLFYVYCDVIISILLSVILKNNLFNFNVCHVRAFVRRKLLCSRRTTCCLCWLLGLLSC